MIKWLRRLIARATPTTLAGRAAAVTALLVAIMVVVAAVGQMLGPGNWPLWEWIKGDQSYFVLLLLLAIALPFIVYFGVRYWNRVEESLYPDIDEAWQGGIEALRNAGISVDSAPLFLVLGGDDVEDAFTDSMRAGGVAFRVERAPTVAGVEPALRWYASDAAIYVLCSRIGALSSLARKWASSAAASPTSMTAWSAAPAEAPSRKLDSPTLRPAALRTITPWDLPAETAPTTEAIWQNPAPDRRTAQLPTDVNADHEARRLRYLCRLIKRARRPRCGINGAVALLPFALADADGSQLQTVIDSVHCDTHAIRNTLWLRFPVTGVVVGMERVEGFGEFAKSLGGKHLTRRLGAGFDVRRLATRERLQRLSDRICDAFEDFVYTLFERQEALWQPRDNRKLYGLLCRVREQLKPKLNTVLAKAFGVAAGTDRTASGDNGQSPALFSGCYLAATGRSADEQAFIKGVLHDKLVHEQSRVEWTEEARQMHALFQIAVWIGWAVFAAMLAILVMRITVWG